MAVADFAEIWSLAYERCDDACDIADRVIKFSERTANAHVIKKARSIADLPGITQLDVGYGMSAWAAILSVDLVGSSNRAVKLGAKKTYVTMHTYMPVMAELASKHGYVVGLRGDGLFAAYGLTKLTGTGMEVTPEVADKAVGDAAKTGKAMIEAADEIVSRVLEEKDIEGKIVVRIGIDVGPIVVTRIGIDSAQEVTTYGPAVNAACKMGTPGHVVMTHRANELWKPQDGGTVEPKRHGSHWVMDFKNQRMLRR